MYSSWKPSSVLTARNMTRVQAAPTRPACHEGRNEIKRGPLEFQAGEGERAALCSGHAPGKPVERRPFVARLPGRVKN